MASDIDVFVAPDPDRVVELFRAIAQLFGELGNRENRAPGPDALSGAGAGPSGSGPSWPSGPPSRWTRPVSPSPGATAATTSGCTPSASPA